MVVKGHAAGEMFGKDALRRIIRAYANKPAREIIVGVLSAVDDFRSSREHEDDVTFVVIKIER
jgi:serine phosphatase RsbU (regulator of sigma subunit)